jgi:catechol 2,3-dioxygenase-like lactoylglutathione lyase family enzyme
MMDVQPQLDHLTVQAGDRKASARRLAEILDVPWAEETGIGPFSAVYVNDGLTLDFDQADRAFPVSHYCFRVDDLAFDRIVGRLQDQGIAYRSTPHGAADGCVNTAFGGRIVYWGEPDGHVWEALTASYARRGTA